MVSSIRGEFLKLVTTRTLLWLLSGEVLVVALTAISTVGSADPASLVGPLHEQQFALLSLINVGLFSLIVGMRSFTDEYRHDTIAHTFLSDPTRTRTLVAKTLTAVVAATLLAAVSLVALSLLVIGLSTAKGGELTLSNRDAIAAAGFLAANALWSMIGVAVGVLARHQVPAIVGGIVWVLVIENLGVGFLGDAGPYLPGQLAHALAGTTSSPDSVAGPVAAGILTAYAAVALMAGNLIVKRRDVG